MRYITALLISLCSFLAVDAQSCLCDPHNYNGGQTWYTVSALSGLTLREGPGRGAEKLDVIPFGEEVLFCNDAAFPETIEDISEVYPIHWTKKSLE
jgi:hypothetical protein